MSRIMQRIFGQSILFSPSDDDWQQKRKRLSAAFYKDKLTPMMRTVVKFGLEKINEWKAKREFEMCPEVTDLLTECVLQCVFGTSSEQFGKLPYYKDGIKSEVYPGRFLQKLNADHTIRFSKIFRIYFDLFDNFVVGKIEREVIDNAERFRNFLRDFINKRREQMSESDYVDQGDFLSMLLKDELFNIQDELMIDECLTFMIAATMTTALLT